MEAMSGVKLAGYSNVYLEREIVIRRSSGVADEGLRVRSG